MPEEPVWPPNSAEWREWRLHYIDGTSPRFSGHNSIEGRVINRIKAALEMNRIEVELGFK